MDAEELFLRNVETIERIAAFVCRRNCVRDEEAADFASDVKCKLLEADYAIIRKFESRSSFSTYLRTVISRLFSQHRVEQWGKWRPSAEAKRLGPKAIVLEQLTTRDGYSLKEAIQILTVRSGAGYTVAELEQIYVRLPPRGPKPVLVPDDIAADVASNGTTDEPLISREREHVARKAAAVIDKTIEELAPEDQMILRLRFWDARKVPEIASQMHIEQKKLYKRLDKLFAIMRRALTDAGVAGADVADLLVNGDHELSLRVLTSEGKTPFGPSNVRGESREGGDSRRAR
jgi:RNA polymerase sigma factor for flagellar operon FliA